MHELLRRVKQTTGVTTLHVTHSVSEADALADRCFWLAADGIQERPLGERQTENFQ
jgi:ABC-type nitrate/sulfonate/bicarbonate transport system ATPase subunit